MKFILGKKIEMTQKFLEDGTAVPVTKVEAGPCVVTQVKTKEKEGYKAAQFGFGLKRKPLNKPLAGHLKGLPNFCHLGEFVLGDKDELKIGDKIDVATFAPGDMVRVIGISKGRGFQGVVKRHGFHGSPASHGHEDQLRMPGSIGSKRQGPVQKGKRMAGRMGGEQVTIKNLEIVEVDLSNNILLIKGALPGARGTLLKIEGEGELKIAKPEETIKAPETPAVAVPAEQVVAEVPAEEPKENIVSTEGKK